MAGVAASPVAIIAAASAVVLVRAAMRPNTLLYDI
jgi:hypothetical protein